MWTSGRWPACARGTLLGERYRVGATLFEGAASRVLRGEDLETRRSVALKVIAPSLSDVVRRSVDVVRELRHPNTLRVEDWGELEGAVYVVTPLVEGVTFRSLLAQPRCAREAFLRVFRALCEGVAHAHALGIVHQDLEPSNVLVQRNGMTVVIDWDLARREGELPAGGPDRLLATPAYMAPERAGHGAASARADVFSLGVILHELMYDRHPADGIVAPGGRRTKGRRARAAGRRPPSTLSPDGEGRFDAVLRRCLHPDPDERYRDARELVDELEGL